MQLITLDSVIRKYLAKKGLPLHFYLDFMLHGQDCLREMQFNTLRSLEVTTLDVNSDTDLVDLPAECAEPVMVALEIGDKIRPIPEDWRVNNRQNSTKDLDFEEGVNYRDVDSDLESFYTSNKEFNGGIFGMVPSYKNSYRILRDSGQLRINNKNEGITKIYLSYLSRTPKQVSSQSVVHPFAENAMYTYMDWKAAENFESNASLNYGKRKEFYNEYRKLRSMLTKWNPEAIVRSLRRGYFGSPKN